jgi:hypothetical protein
MPSPRQHLRGRRGWSGRHFRHLWCGWDFQGNGWGMLSQLDDETLLDTIADMQRCWNHHREKITAAEVGLNDHEGGPWFAQYAGPEGNWRLFVHNHRARSYMEYQRANNGWRPYAEFLKTYTPPEPASAAADSTF